MVETENFKIDLTSKGVTGFIDYNVLDLEIDNNIKSRHLYNSI